jgi:hypothetical protein
VKLDGRTIFEDSANFDAWKEPRVVVIGGALPPGIHVLQIAVFNRSAQPCLLAWSEELHLQSGTSWYTLHEDGRRSPAVLATSATVPAEALRYPSVADAFAGVAPWLLAVFTLAFTWTAWNGRSATGLQQLPRWRLSPARLRWVLLAAWTLLAVNNIGLLPGRLGYDWGHHLDYVKYVATRHRLPLATEGWQMFQPPLFYLLEAPIYALLSPRYGNDVVIDAMRVLPLLCGLAQIEIVYRVSRAVFPQSEDLQAIATVVGGLMPMQIYISQVIGNEPLVGSLTALVTCLCIGLLMEPARERRASFFVLIGVIWGLAILSKVTPLLLAPLLLASLLLASLAMHWRHSGQALRQGLVRAALVFGACFLTCGWYFMRNWAALGKPFAAGSFDPVAEQNWWQFPSYRTWDQLTSFGTSLSHPINHEVWSLGGGLYSTLWLDGFVSGTLAPPEAFPWNLRWVLAGAWLGLVPMGFLLASPATCWRSEFRPARWAMLFALSAIGIYLAAVVDLYIRLPVYSACKATYLLGLLPCIAVLAAAGAAPLLRYRLLRALAFAAVTCWGFASYVAYFDSSAIRWLSGAGS